MKTAKTCRLMVHWHKFVKFGDPTRTRTPNLLIRSQLLYPVELWDRLLRLLRILTVGIKGNSQGGSCGGDPVVVGAALGRWGRHWRPRWAWMRGHQAPRFR